MPNAPTKNCTIKASKNHPFGSKLSRSPRDRRRAFWSDLENLKRDFERDNGLAEDSVVTEALQRSFVTRVRVLWSKWLPDVPFPAEWAAVENQSESYHIQ